MGAKVRASGIRYQYILGLDEPDWYERAPSSGALHLKKHSQPSGHLVSCRSANI